MAKGEEYTGEDFILSLSDYAEKNFEDIKLLEKYVGDWSNSHAMYKFLDTPISEWIGNIDDLYGAESSYFLNHQDKTLVKIIGDVTKMWERYNRDGSMISLADALIAIHNIVDDVSEQHNTDLEDMRKTTNNIQYIIGNPIKEDGTNKPYIYSYLDQLSEDLEAAINDSKSRDKALEDGIEDAVRDVTAKYQAADAEQKTQLNDRIDAEVESINTTIANTKKELDDKIDSEVESINTTIANTKKELNDNIENVETTLDKKIEDTEDSLTSTISTLAARLDAEDASIKTTISNHVDIVAQSLESINTSINNVTTSHNNDNNALWSAIGTGENPSESTILGRLNDNDESLTLHNNRITNLEESLGENDGNPIAGRVKKNEEDIASLSSQLSKANTDNKAQFESINGEIDKLKETDVSHTSAIAQTNSAISEINTKILNLENINHSLYETKENAQTKYGTIDAALNEHTETLTNVNESIEGIQAILGEDSDEILTEGQNVLTLLSDLSN